MSALLRSLDRHQPLHGPLLCRSGSPSCRLGCLPLPACRSGPAEPPAPPGCAGPTAGGQGRAPRSRPRSVLRFLIIPEVLNVIAANLGGRRVRGLMTTSGSADPSSDARRKEWTEEGRKEGAAVRPSICRSTQAPEAWTEGSVKGGTWVSTPGSGGWRGPFPPCRFRSQARPPHSRVGGSCPGRTAGRTHRHLGSRLLVCPRTHVGTPGGQVGLQGHLLALALCLAPPPVPGPPAPAHVTLGSAQRELLCQQRLEPPGFLTFL